MIQTAAADEGSPRVCVGSPEGCVCQFRHGAIQSGPPTGLPTPSARTDPPRWDSNPHTLPDGLRKRQSAAAVSNPPTKSWPEDCSTFRTPMSPPGVEPGASTVAGSRAASVTPRGRGVSRPGLEPGSGPSEGPVLSITPPRRESRRRGSHPHEPPYGGGALLESSHVGAAIAGPGVAPGKPRL